MTGAQKVKLWEVVLLILGFWLFFFFAAEDRVFKNWRWDISSMARTYSNIKKWSRNNIISEGRILVDYSVFKKWKAPFNHGLLGEKRRDVYFSLFPDARQYFIWGFHEYGSFGVERLNEKKRFKMVEDLSREAREELNMDNLRGLLSFMKEKEIVYFICSTSELIGRKNEYIGIGFEIIYNNKRFAAFSVREEPE